MKRYIPSNSSPAGRSSALTDTLLALLLAAGLFQIVVCFEASARLIPAVTSIQSGMALPTCQTNAPLAHGTFAPRNEKS